MKYISKKVISVLVVVITCLLLTGCSSDHRLDNFAKCLKNKGAVLYTTYWCSNCKVQKDMFKDSVSKLKIVECDPNGENSQHLLCTKKNIQSIPTWEFATGTIMIGVQELVTLEDQTGCKLPDEY